MKRSRTPKNPLVGEQLLVRAGERMVELYHQDRVVAMHVLASRPGQFMTNDLHYPPEKVAHMQRNPQWCLRRAKAVGPCCHDFITKLLGERVVDRLAGAQGIVRGFLKKYGPKRLEAACTRALDYESVNYRALKTILEKGLDQVPDQPDRSGQLHFCFLDAPRFARDIGQMLAGGCGR